MDFDSNRRAVLKLAALFAAALSIDKGYAMEAAPRPSAAAGPAGPAKKTRTNSDAQNEWAPGKHSNFKAIYGSPAMRDAFFLFLQNVYNLYPEDKFHRLIEEINAAHGSDKEIYLQTQARIKEIAPILGSVRYALPALRKQKAEMTRQTLELLRAQRKINGFLELGSTGRYLGHLRSEIEISGDVVLINTDAASYSPTDIVERGGVRKIGRFVPLNDYAPVQSTAVADNSLDLVANFIGFHHSPPERLDAFVRSFHRVLRPGGRLIVRDHDVSSTDMNHMVALAHDVFNLGLGTEWSVNQREIRNFTSIRQLERYLTDRGFKVDGRALLQPGDPTHNALMMFTKI